MFILLFHCFLWGMGGGGLDSHTRMSSIFVAFKRGEGLLPLYFFSFEGWGSEFQPYMSSDPLFTNKVKV